MFALQENEIFAERYLLGQLVGTRGVSEVWVAEDQMVVGAVVALKIYAPLNRVDQVSLDLLRNDIQNNQSLNHPHILRFNGFEVYQGTPYLVMPYMANGSLSSRLQEKGPFTEQELALLLKQMGSALRYLHNLDPAYLHQNIKPDNILIADDGGFILTDVGLTHRTRNALHRSIGLANALPTAYAPPEQFTSQPTANAASDIFSFGVTLYELCAGHLPWMGGGGVSLVQGAAVPYIPDTYPRVLSNIVRACMDVAWEKRPSAEELEAEGAYFLQNGNWKTYGRFGIVTVKLAEPEREFPLKKILIAVAILILLSLGGYALYIYQQQLPAAVAGDEADAVVLTTAAARDKIETEQERNRPQEAEAATTAPQPAQSAAAATPSATPATAPATSPATPTVPARRPMAKAAAKPKAKVPVKRLATRKPAYPKPTSLEGYFSELRNEDIPIEERESWKPAILRYFSDRAAVNYVVRGELIGILSADEIVDILLSSEDSTRVRIGNVSRNETGKIEEITVNVSGG